MPRTEDLREFAGGRCSGSLPPLTDLKEYGEAVGRNLDWTEFRRVANQLSRSTPRLSWRFICAYRSRLLENPSGNFTSNRFPELSSGLIQAVHADQSPKGSKPMSRTVISLLGCLLIVSTASGQQTGEAPSSSGGPFRQRGTVGGTFGSSRADAPSSRSFTASVDPSAVGKLVTLEILIAAPAEAMNGPTAARILELEKTGKLKSAMRLHLAALENQSGRVQFQELVARVTGHSTGRTGQSMPNYQDVTVGTTAQAISRVHEDGAVIAQLTIERSSVAVVAAAAVREGAADQPTIEPPPAVQTLATQTATPHGLLETAHGECPQDGDCSVDTTASRGRLVAAADRQGTGDRSRHGGAILTTAATRPKTSHSARRLSGAVQMQPLFRPSRLRRQHVGW